MELKTRFEDKRVPWNAKESNLTPRKQLGYGQPWLQATVAFRDVEKEMSRGPKTKRPPRIPPGRPRRLLTSLAGIAPYTVPS